MQAKIVGTAIAAAAVLILAQPVAAQTVTPPPVPAATADDFSDDRRILNGGRTIFGEEFVLRSNEMLRGDLTVFGGDAVLERGSIVEGDVAIFGGSLQDAGRITGDLAQIGGSIDMRESARVDGQLSHLGGGRTIDPGAVIGERVELTQPSVVIPGVVTLPEPVRTWANEDRTSWLSGDAWKVFPGALLITLAALISWALLPRRIDLAVDAVRAQPLFVGAVGAFAWIAGGLALAISLVLVVTLCVSPLVALAALSVSWAVTARIVGVEVMRAFGRAGWSAPTQLAAGSLIMALLGAIPIIGSLLGFAFASLGLGSLVLTRLGTRAWKPTADDRPPTTDDRRPTTAEVPPTTGDRPPTTTEGPPPAL